MSFGICSLSVIPCRKEPSGASEMVTQLLFGETYKIVNANEDWLEIITSYDSYPCWISIKQHTPIDAKNFEKIDSSILNLELIQVVNSIENGQVFPVTIGATLPNFKNGQFDIASSLYTFEGTTCSFKEKKSIKEIKQTAFLFLNAPYLWGGRSPFGIDCSGFTQLVYKLNGYKLPRDARQQVELGKPLSFVEEAEEGDLAFFDNEEGNIVHVGIVLENQQIIHASGSVRIDKFDHYGIFHSDNKKYSHMLRVIKKII
jgi:hypothetical protein